MSSEDYKKQVEAILFTVGRQLTTQEIAEILGLGSVGIVKNVLNSLLEEYKIKDSALEIIQEGDKFRMNIKGEHMHVVKNLMPVTELDKSVLETLAIIAWKQPVLQSDVVKVRGNKTYEHMKGLIENEFVSTEPKGLSKIIKLTPKFYQYFDTNKDKIKQELEQEVVKTNDPELPEITPSEEMPKFPGQEISPLKAELKEKRK